jgi:sigma-B regulation protein RsbU (phosphoserine phosphatase)
MNPMAEPISEIEALRAEIRELKAQLEAKTRIATRAMATYQQRALQMEEHATELRAKNDEVRRINDRLSETLRTLEQRDRLITNDLEQAQRFQELILPDPPESDGIKFSVFYRPAELVGGDVYDICERRPGQYRVFLADATGHGVQAALRTMLLKAEYDRLKDAKTPEQTLVALNANITANYPGLEMQCSASCFDIILGARGKASVRYATAAHPPLLIFRDGSAASSIYKPGPFLGVVPAIELESVDLEIDAGHRLLVYSDGLEEQWNASHQEFGLVRVEAALADRERDLTACVQCLIDDWTTFLAGNRPDDDATLIAAECLG